MIMRIIIWQLLNFIKHPRTSMFLKKISKISYFNNIPVLLRVLTLNLATFTIGIIFSWPSPSIPKLNGSIEPELNPLETPLTTLEESWLVSLPFLSASLGSLMPSLMPIRRKLSLIILTLPVIVGFLMFAFCSKLWLFYVAQSLSGITMGGAFQIVPRYVAEISENHNRGAMGCFLAIFLGIGNTFAFAVGPYVTFKVFNLICLIIPITFLILITLFVEDSPYDYALVSEKRTAAILQKLRSCDSDITGELEEIKALVSIYNRKLRLGDFRSKALRRSLIICLMLVIFQQLSGVNVIMAYLQTIFDYTSSSIPPDLSAIYVGCVQIAASFAIPLFVDNYGRKITLLVSHAIVTIALIAFSAYFYLKLHDYNTTSINWLPILCLMIYIIFFNSGLGCVTYILMGEIFPGYAQNFASTLTTSILTLAGFVMTWIFPILVESINMDYTFWMVTVFSSIGFVLMVFLVPETKGKSFMEIQGILEK